MSTAPLLPLLLSGVSGRCPQCHRGALFAGYLRVVERCGVCGLTFAGHDAGDGPAFFVILPLSIVTAVLALLVEVKFQPPLWVHAVAWPAFIALAVGSLLRPVKGIMIALQYRYRDVERDPEIGG